MSGFLLLLSVPVATVCQLCVIGGGGLHFGLWHTFILVTPDEASSVGQVLNCLSTGKKIFSLAVEGSCHRMRTVVLKRVATEILGDAIILSLRTAVHSMWKSALSDLSFLTKGQRKSKS